MKKILWKRMKRNRRNAQIAKIICTLIRICLVVYTTIAFMLLFVDEFIILMNDTTSNVLGFTAVISCYLYMIFMAVEGVYIKKYELSKKEFINYN